MPFRSLVATPAPPLAAFIADLRAARQRRPRPDAVASFARARLATLISDRTWLPASACEGRSDRYTQHVLAVAPDRSFSVVALVWDPGQATPIHDHVCWCVVGVYEGEESQIRYHLMEERGERYLVEIGRERGMRGDCSQLVPPEENIHQVSNASNGRAISIHVYGADIEALGSSINQRFDGLPIRIARATDGADRRTSWRTTDPRIGSGR